MCRLAAFPPNTSRTEAIEILLEMQGCNLDGVGSVYVNKGGEFVVDKYPCSLSSLLRKQSKELKKGEGFLSHMPHDGWTVAHLRAASHGGNTFENTHPFITADGNYAVVHNGIWSDYRIAKLCLEKSIEFKGQTDSEVAANLISLVGPERFSAAIDFGGVYLALQKDGQLWVIKTSGQLELVDREVEGTLLASEFDRGIYFKQRQEVFEGCYHFAANGTFIGAKKKASRWGRGRFRDEDWDRAAEMIAQSEGASTGNITSIAIHPENAHFVGGGLHVNTQSTGKPGLFAPPPLKSIMSAAPGEKEGMRVTVYPTNGSGGKARRYVIRHGVRVQEE